MGVAVRVGAGVELGCGVGVSVEVGVELGSGSRRPRYPLLSSSTASRSAWRSAGGSA